MQELYWGLLQCLRGWHCRGQEDPEGFYSELWRNQNGGYYGGRQCTWSIRDRGGRYLLHFGSHMSAASSEDLRNWTSIGDGYTSSNPIFDDLLGTEHVFDYTGSKDSVIPTDDGTYHVWAPDVVYNRAQDLYYMYFVRLRPGMHRICVMRFQINRKDRIHGRERSSIPDLQKIRSGRPMCSIMWTSTM